MEPTVTIALQAETIDTAALIESISEPWCGAIVSFEGRIRDNHNGREVTSLFYETHEPLAIKQLRAIADNTLATFDLGGVAIVHRIGDVPLGDVAVLIATSSAHRSEAFAATQQIIDDLKESVAIWKKEVFVDGQAWVGIPDSSVPNS